MAINHADHDHPATPAARAACRKAMGTDQTMVERNTAILEANRRGELKTNNTVLKGVAPRGRKSREAKPFTIKHEGDLAAEVPHLFSGAIRYAWDKGWTVRSAHPYNDTEKRIEITSEHGTLALVYKSANPNAVWGVFFRPINTSITSRIEAAEVGIVNEGMRRLARGV